MKLFVRVKPGSKISKIEEKENGHFEVWLKSRAEEGKANEELISVIAKKFKVPKSKVGLVRGHKSKDKVLEIV